MMLSFSSVQAQTPWVLVQYVATVVKFRSSALPWSSSWLLLLSSSSLKAVISGQRQAILDIWVEYF